MEAVIFIGLQASGKSTFYKERFFKTHIRINLDMLRTRKREEILIEACVKAKQPFVIDNTNPNKEDRKRYFELLKESKFKIKGYYFDVDFNEAVSRNNLREGIEKIPLPGLRRTHSRLESPAFGEGFDELYSVRLDEEKNFIIRDWENND